MLFFLPLGLVCLPQLGLGGSALCLQQTRRHIGDSCEACFRTAAPVMPHRWSFSLSRGCRISSFFVAANSFRARVESTQTSMERAMRQRRLGSSSHRKRLPPPKLTERIRKAQILLLVRLHKQMCWISCFLRTLPLHVQKTRHAQVTALTTRSPPHHRLRRQVQQAHHSRKQGHQLSLALSPLSKTNTRGFETG